MIPKPFAESNDEIILPFSVQETDMIQNNSGWTPLIRACRYGQTNHVSRLISSGVDVTVCDNLGWGPVPFAVASRNITTVKEILSAKRWSREDLAPALCLSALNGDCDMTELLLSAGGNPNTSVEASEITPLMLAAGEGDVEMVALLLEKGADPDKTNALHQTALDAAVCRGHLNVQDILATVTHLRSKVSSHIPLPISPPNKALQSSPDRTQTCNPSSSPFPAPGSHNPFLIQIASPCQSHTPRMGAFQSTEPCSTPVGIARNFGLQCRSMGGACSPFCRPTHEDFEALRSPFLTRGRQDYLSPFPAFCSSDAGCSFNFATGIQRQLDNHSSPYHKDGGYCWSDNLDKQIDKSSQKTSVCRQQKMVLRWNKSFRQWWCHMKKRCTGTQEAEESMRFSLKDNRWHEKRLLNFLRSIKMAEYFSLFTSQEVDFETFLTLTDTDLEEIGIKNASHRSKIVDKASAFTARGSST